MSKRPRNPVVNGRAPLFPGASRAARPAFAGYRFSGHQTFPFRHGWFAKAAQGIAEDPDLFARDDALARLGVGKNMVASMRHWCEAAGVIEFDRRSRNARMTDLGELLIGPISSTPPPPRKSRNGNGLDPKTHWTPGADPWLEEPATLWLIHWRLAGRPAPASTWHLALTCYPEVRATSPDLVRWLARQAGGGANGSTRRAPAISSLKRDAEVFLRTYLPPRDGRRRTAEDSLDCPLAELGLLRPLGRGAWEMPRGLRPSLPDSVLGFAILEFRETEGGKTLTIEQLLFHPGSPGGAFRLDDRSLIAALERLSKDPEAGIAYDETAGLRLVHFHGTATPMDYLRQGYPGR